jgi:hypothetical protein
MANFDAKHFSKIDWAVVGAAGVSFICLFLPWYGSLSAHLGTVSRPPSFCTLGAEDFQPLEFGDEFA